MTIQRIHPQCCISIGMPAMNEEASIAAALGAFADQRNLDGTPMDPTSFEIIVLANGCEDATVGRIARFRKRHPKLAIAMLACDLPTNARHVGTARRMVLDIAASRQRENATHGGIIASTDADSIVDPFWIAQTLREMRTVDAVAGYVEVSLDDRDRMAAPLRLLYDRERTYQRLRADVETSLDPVPHDPPTRHDLFVGASFAVRVPIYERAGRLPVVPKLEDFAFARALRRIDARVRHSYDVRVETSARFDARVDGGFASMLATFHERGRRRESVDVEHADRTIARAIARARLRAFWSDPQTAQTADLCHAYGVTFGQLCGLVDRTKSFGMSLDAVEATGPDFEKLPDQPIERAIAALRIARTAHANASAYALQSDVG